MSPGQRFGRIEIDTWDDDKFLAVSSDAKVLFVWAFTHRWANMAGLYRATLAEMGRVLQDDVGRAQAALTELRDARLLLFDPTLEQLWVVNRARYVNGTPAQAHGIARAYAKQPDGPLKQAFAQRYPGLIAGPSDDAGTAHAGLTRP